MRDIGKFLMIAGVVAAVVLRYTARTLAHGMLGSTAIFLAFFAFNKAAHLNYYWLAEALLLLALLLAVAESHASVLNHRGTKGTKDAPTAGQRW